MLLAELIALAAGINVFNSASQFRQISANAVVGSHGADRTVEETVGLARRVGDFLAAHIDDLIHARAEFRAVGILSDEIADEAIDLFVQLRPFFVIKDRKSTRLNSSH